MRDSRAQLAQVIGAVLGEDRAAQRRQRGDAMSTAETSVQPIWSAHLARCVRSVHRPLRRSRCRDGSRAWSASRSRRSAARPRSATIAMSSRATAHASRPKSSAFAGERLFLMPTGDPHGLEPSARVIPRQRAGTMPGGAGAARPRHRWRGRAARWARAARVRRPRPPHGRPINPLSRQPIAEPLDVGVRAINALLTVGRGQRIGLFAGSGVGKSVLLGMMARYTSADVIVVGLIGERGREVQGIRRADSGPEGPAPRRRGRDAGRSSAAHAPARRVARDGDRRVFPRPGRRTCCCSWIR